MNAWPELDFKYFSKLNAFVLSENAQYQINLYGLFESEYFAFPELCSASLRFKSEVTPIYLLLSFSLCKIYT